MGGGLYLVARRRAKRSVDPGRAGSGIIVRVMNRGVTSDGARRGEGAHYTTRTTDFLCSRVASPGLACALRQAVAAASCLDFVALLAIGARLVDGLSVASLDAILSGFIGHILV
jgi:hypothetical protein